MWAGKKKALTFSFDDGITQDVELVKIFNDYGLKSTFNLNSGRFGKNTTLDVEGTVVLHNKIKPEQVQELYKGHEVAAHTVTHPNLALLSDEEIVREVEEDRKTLERLVGYDVVGMAYPGGGYDDRVVKVLKEKTKILYARTTVSSYNFAPQKDLLRFAPTVYFIEWEKLFELAKVFIEKETEEDQLFYIWGHSYELDAKLKTDWKEIERFCKYVSRKEEIFYGTNREVLLK